jgi:hypothetical protein
MGILNTIQELDNEEDNQHDIQVRTKPAPSQLSPRLQSASSAHVSRIVHSGLNSPKVMKSSRDSDDYRGSAHNLPNKPVSDIEMVMGIEASSPVRSRRGSQSLDHVDIEEFVDIEGEDGNSDDSADDGYENGRNRGLTLEENRFNYNDASEEETRQVKSEFEG